MSAKRKRAYDATIKLKAVEVAEKSSKEAEARQFRVDPRSKRCQDSPCALTLYASNGKRAKFVHVKIKTCLKLAPVSNKRWVNWPPKKIDARTFNGIPVGLYRSKKQFVKKLLMKSTNVQTLGAI